MASALLVGLGLGLLVAAQVGPISLLLIRSVLRGRATTGLAIGAGAATVDTLYAVLGVAGVAPLLQAGVLRVVLGLTGALVLGWLGFRTLWTAFRIRLGGEDPTELATPWRAFVTALGATASNPLTIVSWAAVFTATSVAGVAASVPEAVALLGGIAIGSLGWFCVLTGLVTVARRWVGQRTLVVVDVLSGLGLIGFGGLLGWRALHAE